MREHRDDPPTLLCECRDAAKGGATTQSGDVRDDDRWGGPETGRTIEDLA